MSIDRTSIQVSIREALEHIAFVEDQLHKPLQTESQPLQDDGPVGVDELRALAVSIHGHLNQLWASTAGWFDWHENACCSAYDSAADKLGLQTAQENAQSVEAGDSWDSEEGRTHCEEASAVCRKCDRAYSGPLLRDFTVPYTKCPQCGTSNEHKEQSE